METRAHARRDETVLEDYNCFMYGVCNLIMVMMDMLHARKIETRARARETSGMRMLDIVYCEDFVSSAFQHMRICCMPESNVGTWELLGGGGARMACNTKRSRG